MGKVEELHAWRRCLEQLNRTVASTSRVYWRPSWRWLGGVTGDLVCYWCFSRGPGDRSRRAFVRLSRRGAGLGELLVSQEVLQVISAVLFGVFWWGMEREMSRLEAERKDDNA